MNQSYRCAKKLSKNDNLRLKASCKNWTMLLFVHCLTKVFDKNLKKLKERKGQMSCVKTKSAYSHQLYFCTSSYYL